MSAVSLKQALVIAGGMILFAAVFVYYGLLNQPPPQAPATETPSVSAGPAAGQSDGQSAVATPASPPAADAAPAASGAAQTAVPPSQPPNAKAAEARPADANAADAKSSEAKSADVKSGDVKPAEVEAAEKPAPQAPAFDVVRVEPSGESVIAGRSAPGATIELLRNGEVHVRAMADATGLFALVPPALPPGTHEIALRSTAPDGSKARSKESVTVVVSPKANEQPVVALASPDQPTVVLSAPERPPETRQAALPPASAPPTETEAAPAPVNGTPKRPNVAIRAVEAEDGGRLYVAGQGAPNATVRLYLNDSFVAPGGAGADGRIAFSIGRGVVPGDYRVRLDDVDPASGSVKSRAEVKFTVPATVSVPLPPAAEPYVTAGRPSPTPGQQREPAQQQAAIEPAQRQAQPPTQSQVPTGSQPAAQTQPAAPSQPAAPAAASKPPVAVAAAVPTAAAQAAAVSRDVNVATVVVPEVNTAIVARGDSLWRISRRIYGRGLRYTEIYDANQTQIRNPRLIYPGQVFVVPSDEN